uniref:Retrovirus-related Pol polyprotein from transposon TNT 1-94 n=1 Tax=Tanacetum cinerariifolium TaxID=118510 RepID=A0A6L2LIB0_TANCI|nr:retrovirus-related Pol polyprotein from transposon TNT 1-94 [Tanacetum cinerariifolium]
MDFASNKPLYLLRMDLCGPMRVQSINEKRYVLVVIDDYSRYTWVFFLHSKDGASEVIISFIKKTQVNLHLQVQRVQTDNGTEFKNKTLAKFFDEDVGKLKAKKDIGVFVGYSKESAAFRIYNKRTRIVSKQYPDHVYAIDKALYVPTLMVEQAKLKLNLVGKPVDHTDYRSMIGSLMYVTSSRPDIVFSTCMCARYQANPNEHHVSVVKRIFHYLKRTINLGFLYPKDSGFDLTSYSDADHAGCHLDRKSTSDSVQFLGDKLVCWSSKKQNCVSISTAESEYVTVSGCCAQVLWMRTQLMDYGFFYDKVPIYCDSKSVIAISCNPVQHTRTKHIDVGYHFIKDRVEKGNIELYFVGTEYQLADLFTKSLPEARFKFLVEKLGMMTLRDANWVSAMQEELDQFARLKVWRLVPRPEGKSVIKTKWIFKNKKDESSLVIRNKARLVAANPNEHHVSTVKRIFRYLKGTINLGRWYSKDSGFVLTAYSDADHAGCHLDRKTESEYVAVSSCCAQVLWMRTPLTDYGFFYDKVPIYCDSKSVIAISCNPDVGKLKEKGDIGVFVGYSKESAAFRIYNKRTRDKLVCWSSKKQNSMSISTAESKYVAVSACCAQVLWMRTQLTNYGFFYDKVLIYCDLKSAVAISCNLAQHTRTKHIDVRYHFIKDHVEKGTIELYFVGTEYQLADLFTKSLPEA